MNIGIDIRTLMDAQYSGVSEYSYNLVKEILKLDASATLSTGASAMSPSTRLGAGNTSTKNNYILFYNSGRDVSKRIPKFIGNYKIISKRYPNKIFNYLMQKTLHYPKIDQILGVNLFFMPHINFISLSPACPSILTIHDLSYLKFKRFFSSRKNLWHALINVKSLMKGFNKIVAVSENTKNDIIELCHIEPDKIKVIYSAISNDYKIIKQDNEQLNKIKKKYSLPQNFILYLGTIEPRKNITGIIHAYEIMQDKNKDLADYKLIIAGKQGWKNKNIIKIWQKSKYKNKIKFLDYIPDKDKVYLYNSACLFIYPSFYEGFGFPPLEAMACGVPVVTSFISSLPEVVGNAAIIIDPYNINQIAMAMKQILTNPDLKNSLIKKGLAQASQFSWENTARQYLELFAQVQH